MAVGESQDCSWAARGCVRSLVSVFFSYDSKAALKTDRKMDEEDEDEDEDEEALGGVWDMAGVERRDE